MLDWLIYFLFSCNILWPSNRRT